MKEILQPIILFLMLSFILSSAIAQEVQLSQSGTGALPFENIRDDCGEWTMYRDSGINDNALGLGGERHGAPNRETNVTGNMVVNDTWDAIDHSIIDDFEFTDSDIYFKSVLDYYKGEYFAGGSGTETDPWLIETAEHLDNIRHFLGAQNSNKFFKQIASIDLGVPPWNQNEGWMPIGYAQDGHYFMGNYNGNGFIINNLTINRPSQEYLGLFGFAVDAKLHAIGLEDVIIDGYNTVGSVSGYIVNTVVTESFATGEILAHNNWGGGLVGISAGNSIIDRCFANVDVFASGFSAGGLTSTNQSNSSVKNSYATGSVSGLRNVGGLVGWMSNSIVDNSYATGYVISHSGGISGGLIGVGNTTNDSYWNIETTAQMTSAGGVPKTTMEMLQQNTFDNWDFTNIWNIEEGSSYPYLSWQQQAEGYNFPPAHTPASSLTGELAETEIILHWSAPSIGDPDGYNIYKDGVLVDFVSGQTSFSDSDVELNALYSYHVTAVYGSNESKPSNTIIIFFFEGFDGGNGTQENPYLIANAQQLNKVRYFLQNHFKQIADIDLGVGPWNEGKGWNPIGDLNNRFEGSYNGDGNTIYSLTINRPEETLVGLFFIIQSNALVQNLNFENVSITGNSRAGVLSGEITNSSTIKNINIISGTVDSFGLAGSITALIHDNCYLENIYSNADVSGTTSVGGIAGGLQANNSILLNSYFTGTVNSESVAGGLIGWLAASGTIHESYSASDVNGSTEIGGLVGRFSNSYIINSYATGSVTGQSKVGGLIGGSIGIGLTGEISNNYSTGEVAGGANSGGLVGWLPDEEDYELDFQNNYWDINSSGFDYSAAGKGLTTLQMLQQNSFVNWCFTEIWGIVENITYPYLQWQGEPGIHNYPHLYELILFMQPPDGGSVEGAGGYAVGTQVNITATANEGYRFVRWTDVNGNALSEEAEFIFTMPDEDMTLTAHFELITNIVENETAEVIVYPIPARDLIYIDANFLMQEVRLLNILGQPVLKVWVNAHHHALNIAEISNGIYFVRVQTENNVKTVRIQINNNK